ncbi:MAG: hypothetical protein O7C59_09695 [Rickettsia endosymbiont of Ixodes persulcatus]|nr:hypothetical protein [Rickettsia endosymbiont of Ixodes persulcatus]
MGEKDSEKIKKIKSCREKESEGGKETEREEKKQKKEEREIIKKNIHGCTMSHHIGHDTVH